MSNLDFGLLNSNLFPDSDLQGLGLNPTTKLAEGSEDIIVKWILILGK